MSENKIILTMALSFILPIALAVVIAFVRSQ
jgi:hypothetical protein